MKKRLARFCRLRYNRIRRGKEALCVVNSLMVANNVLQRAKRDGIEDVSPMKLQKLVYLIYARYLYLGGQPLFLNRFEVWKHGPVEREMYNYFGRFGGRPIRDTFAEINGKRLCVDEDASPLFKKVLDEVWERYKYDEAWKLSEMTHEDGSAWHKMRQNDSWYIDVTEIREDGRRFFDEKIS